MTKAKNRRGDERPGASDGIDPELRPLLDLIAEELTAEYLRLLKAEAARKLEGSGDATKEPRE